MADSDTLYPGDLVNVRSWRDNSSRVGVIVRPVRDSQVADFSRYEILIENEVISIRRDRIEKVEKSISSSEAGTESGA